MHGSPFEKLLPDRDARAWVASLWLRCWPASGTSSAEGHLNIANRHYPAADGTALEHPIDVREDAGQRDTLAVERERRYTRRYSTP